MSLSIENGYCAKKQVQINVRQIKRQLCTNIEKYLSPTANRLGVSDAVTGEVFVFLDLLMGYHKVLVEPAVRLKTAFITHKGLFI